MEALFFSRKSRKFLRMLRLGLGAGQVGGGGHFNMAGWEHNNFIPDFRETLYTVFPVLDLKCNICRRIVYGENDINVPVQSVLTLLVMEALTPFYIFQMFSLILWLVEQYIYFSIAIIIMSIVGITTSIIQTRKVSKFIITFLKNRKIVINLKLEWTMKEKNWRICWILIPKTSNFSNFCI